MRIVGGYIILLRLFDAKPLPHIIHTTPSCIMHRNTPKRGESGSKNHGAVQNIQIIDHAFPETSYTGIEHGESQAIRDFFIRLFIHYRHSLPNGLGNSYAIVLTRGTAFSPFANGQGRR